MKYEASPSLEGRPPVAHLVALRRLDLDHLGAVVAEHLGAVRAAEHASQIDDDEPCERARAAGMLLPH